ncbi:MAG: hypothetical protein C0524_10025 [Rhodobacter sp.]|nr:hypothetical protein [Rhodobacter sp.]
MVEASLSHLLRLVQANGRFVYAHPAGQPRMPLNGYNMLRHCGTLWFMLRAVNDLDLDLAPDARAALGRAVEFAANMFERPLWIRTPSLALVTKGAVKTGGIGLALVMLEEYRRALPRGLDEAALPLGLETMIAGLQAYALAQIEGGDFLHKRLFSDGTVLPFRSDFYTGEALLGLFVTGNTDPALLAATEALVARRYGVAEQSHWMAYASCEAAARGLISEARITGYITELMEAIVEHDAYRARRMSTPIACRSEALTRFARLCDQWPGRFPEALRAAAMRVTDENLGLQLRWYADGQFWKGDDDDKVQIDYIQHNATAFLNLWLCL